MQSAYSGQSSYFHPSGKSHGSPSKTYRDPESLEEVPLVPGLSKTENLLRWGFIQKVYGIIAFQLLLTAAVCMLIYMVQPIQNFILNSVAFQVVFAVLPLIGLIPLYIYQRRHPWNMLILAAWTVSLSIGVGTACSMFAPLVLFQALCLTASIVFGLTAYAFHASRNGKDFSFMAPMLTASLCGMLVWGVLQIFVPLGQTADSIYSLLGAILFSGFIVFDTAQLIKTYDLDQYIWASVNLYLDIINLFMKILRMLNRD